jgi:hypothetical protein
MAAVARGSVRVAPRRAEAGDDASVCAASAASVRAASAASRSVGAASARAVGAGVDASSVEVRAGARHPAEVARSAPSTTKNRGRDDGRMRLVLQRNRVSRAGSLGATKTYKSRGSA